MDERTINIKPAGPGIPRQQGNCVLDSRTSGVYTLHRIEFPGYVETTSADPTRLVARIRTTPLAERYSQCGGCSFPNQSGAVFTVEVTDASSRPVQFTSPVHLTAQFKGRLDSAQTDVVRFDGRTGVPENMRLVWDRFAGEAVDFVFLNAPSQTVNAGLGTVTLNNFVGLTGADGCGTFGAVARDIITATSHWRLYR